jgi:hypothetical protein
MQSWLLASVSLCLLSVSSLGCGGADPLPVRQDAGSDVVSTDDRGDVSLLAEGGDVVVSADRGDVSVPDDREDDVSTGVPCRPDSCPSGTECFTTGCLRVYASGEFCSIRGAPDRERQCARDTTCTGRGRSELFCEPRGNSGAGCRFEVPYCNEGLACIETGGARMCVPALPVGAFCAGASMPCTDGTACQVQNGSPRCVRNGPNPVRAGGDCDDDGATCVDGFSCVASDAPFHPRRCVPDGTLGAPGRVLVCAFEPLREGVPVIQPATPRDVKQAMDAVATMCRRTGSVFLLERWRDRTVVRVGQRVTVRFSVRISHATGRRVAT